MRYLIWREWADDPATRARAEAEIAALHPGDPQLAHFDSAPSTPPPSMTGWPVLRSRRWCACPARPRAPTPCDPAPGRASSFLLLFRHRGGVRQRPQRPPHVGLAVRDDHRTRVWNASPRGRAAMLRQPETPLPRSGRDRCEGRRRGRLLCRDAGRRGGALPEVMRGRPSPGAAGDRLMMYAALEPDAAPRTPAAQSRRKISSASSCISLICLTLSSCHRDQSAFRPVDGRSDVVHSRPHVSSRSGKSVAALSPAHLRFFFRRWSSNTRNPGNDPGAADVNHVARSSPELLVALRDRLAPDKQRLIRRVEVWLARALM